MEKMLTVNQKRVTKKPENKKKQPLKVVYVPNPIKFKTSASEFRALVQELTGQDANTPESSRFCIADGGKWEAADALKLVAEDNVSALNEKVTKTEHNTSTYGEVISDPFSFGSFDGHIFCTPQMMENFQGLMASNLWH